MKGLADVKSGRDHHCGRRGHRNNRVKTKYNNPRNLNSSQYYNSPVLSVCSVVIPPALFLNPQFNIEMHSVSLRLNLP
jgi:hypothetical protein